MSTARATSWSITINNPSAKDEECINLARQKSGWSVIGQLEKGENGTPHYQLMLKTPQVRFSAIKKAFPRAHIEVARNADALETYVGKEETRIGELQTSNEMYPSLSKLWDLFYQYSLEFDQADLKWLDYFDEFINYIIKDGYHVETMAVNPQIRAIVAKFMPSIFERCENVRRQADRQTKEQVEVDEIISSGYNINNDYEIQTNETSPSITLPQSQT